jgi:PIN domain nuclease of toxin-antitoxin system
VDLLLDTCAFIWWDSGGDLSAVASSALHNPANRLHLSHASLWEMQLKHQKGKLLLRKPLADIIQEQRTQNGLLLFALTREQIEAYQAAWDKQNQILAAQAETITALQHAKTEVEKQLLDMKARNKKATDDWLGDEAEKQRRLRQSKQLRYDV